MRAFEEADTILKDRGKTSPLFAGSLAVLELLLNSGLKLGILSADSTAGVEAFVECHQLSDYIQLKMGVDGGITKPNPALFLEACQFLGVSPGEALMVGDSLRRYGNGTRRRSRRFYWHLLGKPGSRLSQGSGCGDRATR